MPEIGKYVWNFQNLIVKYQIKIFYYHNQIIIEQISYFTVTKVRQAK